MRIADLPPEDYRSSPSEYIFGPWLELWLLTEPALAVRLRPGWIIEVGKGTIGREKALLLLDSPVVTILPTKGETRLSFRARKSNP